MTGTHDFPADFLWGAATAAYQIEGGAEADGRGPSIWDDFCRVPKKVQDGDTGDVACDHYRRWREDVALMKEMGLKAYRLSISWSRVLPEGTGRVNEAGLAFYERLIDELRAAGIRPFVTLYHWDLPSALQAKGGWQNREVADWFAEYAGVVVERLSDRVEDWITLNEIQNFVLIGHRTGVHAPGLKLDRAGVLSVAHNALLAHGKAARAIRARAKGTCRVGFAPAGFTAIPASGAPEDVEAARRFMFPDEGCEGNAWWVDPAVLGRYPERALREFGADAPRIEAGDLETIGQPLDFLGLNIYRGTVVRRGGDGRPETVPFPPGYPRTLFGWVVTPEALYWGPKFFAERYGLPIHITENGMSNADVVSLDGAVHDPQRIDFLRRYLGELRRAVSDGVDVRGYFLWSFMDNFEWQRGYRERFGIVYVDYWTQRRIPKDSALWYRDMIRSGA
ncbi:MAG: GH1 family beta-glucosidase [Planctomycetota bacterium]